MLQSCPQKGYCRRVRDCCQQGSNSLKTTGVVSAKGGRRVPATTRVFSASSSTSKFKFFSPKGPQASTVPPRQDVNPQSTGGSWIQKILRPIGAPVVRAAEFLEERYSSEIVYAKIVALFGLLFLLRSPVVFSLITIVAILLQNSTTDSLNQLIIFFFDSGMFTSFTEAAVCARLVTWLAVFCTIVSHIAFNGQVISFPK